MKSLVERQCNGDAVTRLLPASVVDIVTTDDYTGKYPWGTFQKNYQDFSEYFRYHYGAGGQGPDIDGLSIREGRDLKEGHKAESSSGKDEDDKKAPGETRRQEVEENDTSRDGKDTNEQD
ncbi:hypothetical protein NDU88_005912 [Pleurodeles waltl]|uniref:Uncharacterized protein n=1 Tax=Pleurodeles waltl TaxID=8319 RepID=A0AAV7PP30_PLEWA|nr:hypothetical protein NDU88_005912 [Pleurodeles waltl]